MADDVLKQFVLALGFDMKSSDQAKFEGAITSAVVKANLATEALLAAAEAAAKFAARLIGSFDQLYYASGRTGASVQNIKALQYAFTQVGGSAQSAMAAVEAFAKAQRTNPGVKQFVNDLGIKRTGDAAIDLIASIDKIREKHPYYVGAQMAGLLGISEEQFNLFDQNAGKLKEKFAEITQLRKTFGVDTEKTAKNSAAFSAALGRLSSVVDVAGEKLLEVLLPSLERVAAAVSNWLNAHPEEIAKIFKAIGDAVDLTNKAFGYLLDKGGDLFKYLSDRAAEMNEDGSFLRMWEKVADVFDRVVRAIQNVITWLKEIDRATDMSDGLKQIGRILGWVDAKTSGVVQSGIGAIGAIDQGTDTGIGVPSDKAKPGMLRRAWDATKRGLGFGGSMDAGGGSSVPITGTTFRQKAPGVMKRLMEDFGLSKQEAAVVLGNLGHESAGFTAFEEGGNGPGRGWAQWTEPGRKRRFFEYAQKNGLDPKSDEANYGFLKWELQNTHKSAIAGLKNSMGEGNKMLIFEERFEGAGVKNYASRNRYMREAERAYDAAQSSPPKAPAFNFPKMPMSPGGFDPSALGSAPPLGGSTINNGGAQVKMEHNTTIKIDGAGDPASVGAQVERAQGRANDLSLRNAQTAIR